MAEQTESAGFGKRPRNVIWSNSPGTQELRTSAGRSLALATIAAIAAVLLGWVLFGLVGSVASAIALGWISAAPVLFGLAVFVSAFFGAVWIAVVALRSLMRTGAVVTLDRRRIIVRTGEGSVVLPWSTTRAKVGALFLSLQTRLFKEGDEPVTILVPMFLLEGGSAAVQKAIEAVGGGGGERREFRSGPARNAAG